MDGDRFDSLSRLFSQRLSRRRAIGRVGTGATLAAVGGAVGPARSRAAAQGNDCSVDLTATVLVGSSTGTTLTGRLTFEVGDDGAIDSAELVTDDGDNFRVVGQATGRALNLRIDLGGGVALSLNGTAQQDVLLCSGAIAGVFSGPRRMTSVPGRRPRAAAMGRRPAAPAAGRAAGRAPAQEAAPATAPATARGAATRTRGVAAGRTRTARAAWSAATSAARRSVA